MKMYVSHKHNNGICWKTTPKQRKGDLRRVVVFGDGFVHVEYEQKSLQVRVLKEGVCASPWGGLLSGVPLLSSCLHC